MIIEIPNENSIIKWKNDEKDEWKVAEISDLIQAYEKPQGEITEEDIQNAIKAGYENGYSMAQAKYQRLKGKWIDAIYTNNGVGVGMCNQCGIHKTIDNFCPNCGADMRGDEK